MSQFVDQFDAFRQIYHNRSIELSYVKYLIEILDVDMLIELVCLLLDRHTSSQDENSTLPPGHRFADIEVYEFLGINDGYINISEVYYGPYIALTKSNVPLIDFFRILRSRTDWTGKTFKAAIVTTDMNTFRQTVYEKLPEMPASSYQSYFVSRVTELAFGHTGDQLSLWLSPKGVPNRVFFESIKSSVDVYNSSIMNIYTTLLKESISSYNFHLLYTLITQQCCKIYRHDNIIHLRSRTHDPYIYQNSDGLLALRTSTSTKTSSTDTKTTSLIDSSSNGQEEKNNDSDDDTTIYYDEFIPDLSILAMLCVSDAPLSYLAMYSYNDEIIDLNLQLDKLSDNDKDINNPSIDYVEIQTRLTKIDFFKRIVLSFFTRLMNIFGWHIWDHHIYPLLYITAESYHDQKLLDEMNLIGMNKTNIFTFFTSDLYKDMSRDIPHYNLFIKALSVREGNDNDHGNNDKDLEEYDDMTADKDNTIDPSTMNKDEWDAYHDRQTRRERRRLNHRRFDLISNINDVAVYLSSNNLTRALTSLLIDYATPLLPQLQLAMNDTPTASPTTNQKKNIKKNKTRSGIGGLNTATLSDLPTSSSGELLASLCSMWSIPVSTLKILIKYKAKLCSNSGNIGNISSHNNNNKVSYNIFNRIGLSEYAHPHDMFHRLDYIYRFTQRNTVYKPSLSFIEMFNIIRRQLSHHIVSLDVSMSSGVTLLRYKPYDDDNNNNDKSGSKKGENKDNSKTNSAASEYDAITDEQNEIYRNLYQGTAYRHTAPFIPQYPYDAIDYLITTMMPGSSLSMWSSPEPERGLDSLLSILRGTTDDPLPTNHHALIARMALHGNTYASSTDVFPNPALDDNTNNTSKSSSSSSSSVTSHAPPEEEIISNHPSLKGYPFNMQDPPLAHTYLQSLQYSYRFIIGKFINSDNITGYIQSSHFSGLLAILINVQDYNMIEFFLYNEYYQYKPTIEIFLSIYSAAAYINTPQDLNIDSIDIYRSALIYASQIGSPITSSSSTDNTTHTIFPPELLTKASLLSKKNLECLIQRPSQGYLKESPLIPYYHAISEGAQLQLDIDYSNIAWEYGKSFNYEVIVANENLLQKIKGTAERCGLLPPGKVDSISSIDDDTVVLFNELSKPLPIDGLSRYDVVNMIYYSYKTLPKKQQSQLFRIFLAFYSKWLAEPLQIPDHPDNDDSNDNKDENNTDKNSNEKRLLPVPAQENAPIMMAYCFGSFPYIQFMEHLYPNVRSGLHMALMLVAPPPEYESKVQNLATSFWKPMALRWVMHTLATKEETEGDIFSRHYYAPIPDPTPPPPLVSFKQAKKDKKGNKHSTDKDTDKTNNDVASTTTTAPSSMTLLGQANLPSLPYGKYLSTSEDLFIQGLSSNTRNIYMALAYLSLNNYITDEDPQRSPIRTPFINADTRWFTDLHVSNTLYILLCTYSQQLPATFYRRYIAHMPIAYTHMYADILDLYLSYNPITSWYSPEYHDKIQPCYYLTMYKDIRYCIYLHELLSIYNINIINIRDIYGTHYLSWLIRIYQPYPYSSGQHDYISQFMVNIDMSNIMRQEKDALTTELLSKINNDNNTSITKPPPLVPFSTIVDNDIYRHKFRIIPNFLREYTTNARIAIGLKPLMKITGSGGYHNDTGNHNDTVDQDDTTIIGQDNDKKQDSIDPENISSSQSNTTQSTTTIIIPPTLRLTDIPEQSRYDDGTYSLDIFGQNRAMITVGTGLPISHALISLPHYSTLFDKDIFGRTILHHVCSMSQYNDEYLSLYLESFMRKKQQSSIDNNDDNNDDNEDNNNIKLMKKDNDIYHYEDIVEHLIDPSLDLRDYPDTLIVNKQQLKEIDPHFDFSTINTATTTTVNNNTNTNIDKTIGTISSHDNDNNTLLPIQLSDLPIEKRTKVYDHRICTYMNSPYSIYEAIKSDGIHKMRHCDIALYTISQDEIDAINRDDSMVDMINTRRLNMLVEYYMELYNEDGIFSTMKDEDIVALENTIRNKIIDKNKEILIKSSLYVYDNNDLDNIEDHLPLGMQPQGFLQVDRIDDLIYEIETTPHDDNIPIFKTEHGEFREIYPQYILTPIQEWNVRQNSTINTYFQDTKTTIYDILTLLLYVLNVRAEAAIKMAIMEDTPRDTAIVLPHEMISSLDNITLRNLFYRDINGFSLFSSVGKMDYWNAIGSALVDLPSSSLLSYNGDDDEDDQDDGNDEDSVDEQKK